MKLHGTRVLLVDDAAEVRMLLRVVLEDRGCLVAEAADAAAGMAAARRGVDVVLLDVQLPDLDGPDVLAALRADPATAQLPVVFLTAEHADDDGLLSGGAHGVLHKPVDLMTVADDLLALLTTAD